MATIKALKRIKLDKDLKDAKLGVLIPKGVFYDEGREYQPSPNEVRVLLRTYPDDFEPVDDQAKQIAEQEASI